MNLVKVKGHPDLVRDLETGAILMTNSNDIERARELKQKKRFEKEEIQQLKTDVKELKDMVKTLINQLGER